MEEQHDTQYALKIAFNTLSERCMIFQQRISALEEENINLRILCNKNDPQKSSLSELDLLKQELTTLNEQNNQLRNKIRIVSLENQQLWANLGKLAHANKNLGAHLNKINDSLSQHVKQSHMPLIRSKTFTQDSPQTKRLQKDVKDKENEKLSLELEDISLKLADSMHKAKKEFDSLFQEIADIQITDQIISKSLGFSYDDETDSTIEELKIILDDLESVKNEAEKQNKILHGTLNNIRSFKANYKCEKCMEDNKRNKELKDNWTETNCTDLNTRVESSVYRNSSHINSNPSYQKICPFCREQFPKEFSFILFVSHVENHFTAETLELT